MQRQERVVTNDQVPTTEESLADLFGSVNLGRPADLDNETLDDELVSEYDSVDGE